MSNRVLTPKFWHCRKGDSDAKKIIQCMRMIPEEKRHEVASEYERLFLDKSGTYWEARSKANKYLGDQARYYKEIREGKNEYSRV